MAGENPRYINAPDFGPAHNALLKPDGFYEARRERLAKIIQSVTNSQLEVNLSDELSDNRFGRKRSSHFFSEARFLGTNR